LAQLSPSVLPYFALCHLRGVWSASRQATLLPTGPGARVGNVAHQLLEEAARGSLHSTDAAAQRWAELIEQTEARMASDPFEKRFLPLRRKFARYEVVRLEALARAAELFNNFRDRPTQVGVGRVGFGVEFRVHSTDDLIVGRIDRVFHTADGPVLQDYKSGALFDPSDADRSEIRPQYITQLHLYAALYHETTGVWPSRLQLIPLNGAARDVDFMPAMCEDLLDASKQILREVNDFLATASDWEEIEARLATPSPVACRHCGYRPSCSKYISLLPTEPDAGWPIDFVGSYAQASLLGNGRFMLLLATKTGTPIYVRSIPSDDAKELLLADTLPGTAVGAFNLSKTQAPNVGEFGDFTVIYISPHTAPPTNE
jgi:RecB family exonuclease